MKRLSWADALSKAIGHARKSTGQPTYNNCPLCIKMGVRDAFFFGGACTQCPASLLRTYAIFNQASARSCCATWSLLIQKGNRMAIKRARQLEAYIRKHPRKWMHMEPVDLAREVKKEKV